MTYLVIQKNPAELQSHCTHLNIVAERWWTAMPEFWRGYGVHRCKAYYKAKYTHPYAKHRDVAPAQDIPIKCPCYDFLTLRYNLLKPK